MKHLLIIDDEKGSRESLRAIFEKDYRVLLAGHPDEGARFLREAPVDLVLLDVMMPGKDGLTFLKEVREIYPDMPIIMVSASSSVKPVVEAIKVGAYDFVVKPFDVQAIRNTVARALESRTLQRQVRALETELSRAYPIDGMVGESEAFKRALSQARQAARSDATVLIHGESGTGKELVARSVHAWSDRAGEPFVAVHCAALSENLLESELFGHEKGAFTGADRRKAGRFDLAGTGSLFFDEIGEMSLATQVKLLRVLQEKEFMRVGGTRVIKTNARIIAATNKDLKKEVEKGRFREDLFYRLNVVPVTLPPLRERPEDIPLLAHYFLERYRRSLNAETSEIAPETLERMRNYAWPGNVRELRNLMERLLVLHRTSRILLPEHLPEEFVRKEDRTPAPPVPAGPVNLAEAVGAYERRLIEKALRDADGVQTRAAKALGTTRRILKYRMEKLGITFKPD